MSADFFYSEKIVTVERVWRTKSYSSSNLTLIFGDQKFEDDSSNLYRVQKISETELILEFNNRKMEIPKQLLNFNITSCFVIEIILEGNPTDEKVVQKIIPKQIKPKIYGEKVLFMISETNDLKK
jgi:hypothetical protein